MNTKLFTDRVNRLIEIGMQPDLTDPDVTEWIASANSTAFDQLTKLWAYYRGKSQDSDFTTYKADASHKRYTVPNTFASTQTRTTTDVIAEVLNAHIDNRGVSPINTIIDTRKLD